MTERAIFRALLAMLLMACLYRPDPAEAACNRLSFCTCTVTATGVSYGTYDTLAPSSDDASGSVRVRCTLLVALSGSFTIDLSAGSSGSYAGRTMRSGAQILPYNLYTNAARTQVWGNGTGGSARVTQSFSGLLVVDRSVPVYGRIPSRQNVRAGAYSDTIVVTVTY